MIGKQSLFCLLYNLLKYEKKFMHKTQISGYSRSTVYKKKRIKSFELCQNAKFLHYFPIIFLSQGVAIGWMYILIFCCFMSFQRIKIRKIRKEV